MRSIHDVRFGLNYTPSRNWWYCWNDFAEEAVARDLDSIQRMEMDHIRLFCLWPWFQPNEKWVSSAHLDRLARLVSLAEARGLDVFVSAMTGWLSGRSSFVPSWLRRRSIFTDPAVIEAEKLYFRELADVLVGAGNFMGFDLGNEINCCWSSERIETADGWMEAMFAYLNTVCPELTHVNGVDHQPFFSDSGFSPQALCRLQPIVSLHCWVWFTGALQRGGPLDPPAVYLPAAMAALARSYAGDDAKPIWIQEYGASEEWMEASTIPRLAELMTLRAWEAGVTWFTWWCSHDIDRMFEFDSLEYSLGAVTVDQEIKPVGYMLRDLARALRQESPPTRSTVHMELPDAGARTAESTWQCIQAWIDCQG